MTRVKLPLQGGENVCVQSLPFFEKAAAVQVARLGSSTLDWGLLITGIPLCLLARAANIFPLSQLANLGELSQALIRILEECVLTVWCTIDAVFN